MLKRLIFGLLFGLFVGGVLAAAVIKGLGMPAFVGTGGAVLAYVFAAVTGVLVGLVAGKPIWASGGQIEAGLKAVVGAGIAAAGMWAMRRWLNLDVDLHTLAGLSPAKLTEAGELPIVTLPLIAGVLGAFYEADNTPETADAKAPKSGAKAAANAKSKMRVAEPDAVEEEEELEAPKKSAKKSR
ncbi:MAG TPA: hypothetical protein VGH28_05815 [Polyangiaceae bacterium]|jgi:hypothetical protein